MTTAHDHAPFPLDALPDHITAGRDIDQEFIGVYLGAVHERCTQCQRADIAQLAAKPDNVAVLVYIAVTIVHDILGGLPPMMLDPHSAEPFTRIVRVGRGSDDADPLYEAAAAMTPDELLRATETALDTLAPVIDRYA